MTTPPISAVLERTEHVVDFLHGTDVTSCTAHSLRQPGFAQAVFVSGEVFRTTKREIIARSGNTESRIQLTKARADLPRFLDPAGERIACRGDVVPRHVIRIALQCLFCPHARFVVAARRQMSKRCRSAPQMYKGVEWAQPRCNSEVLDGTVWFAEPYPRPTAVRPCRCQIRIEHKRTIDGGDSTFEVAHNTSECITAEG